MFLHSLRNVPRSWRLILIMTLLAWIKLVSRAQNLYELGNSPSKTKQILTDLHQYSDKQINIAIQDIENKEKKKNKSRLIMLYVIAGILISICVISAGIMMFLSSSVLSKTGQISQFYDQAATKVVGMGTEYPAIPPGGVQTVAPLNVYLLNVPTPMIEIYETQPGQPNSSGQVNNPVGRTACPTNDEEAALLFGGTKENWKMQQGHWLLTANNGATVFIPEGMSGGYLIVGSALEMKSILGPARVSNIYMIIITCE